MIAGIHTGSMIMDTELMNNGFPGEPVTNCSVLLVKTHERTRRDNVSKTALLITSQIDSFIAEKNRKYAGHTGTAPESEYSNRGEYVWTCHFRCLLQVKL